MARKTYGQVWATNPCLKRHAPKQGNWIARMRLVMLLNHIKQHQKRGVLPPDADGLYKEIVVLAKMVFPEMKPLEIHHRARGLNFEL